MLRSSRSLFRSLPRAACGSRPALAVWPQCTVCQCKGDSADTRICSLLVSISAGSQSLQLPFAVQGQRWSSGLAQQQEPVEESDIKDHHVSNKGAGDNPDKTYEEGRIAPTPGLQTDSHADGEEDKPKSRYWLMQPVYSSEYVESIKPQHLPPEKWNQKLAVTAVWLARAFFDRLTGYDLENMNEKKWLRRILFLETVAGVPGMVGGMLRHMQSLRSMRRDNGWIHTLLEEAENERMHLLTFLSLRQPGMLFRGTVLVAQGVFFNAYFLAYIISPKSCHAFVGYLEEEAVKTYTHAISDLDSGRLPEWASKEAPKVARDYWKLGDEAMMRDLLLAVRADEACHSHVNHTFSTMKSDERNPFNVGTHHVPQA